MLDAPRQDWSLYRQLTEAYDRQFERSLTSVEKFSLYQDLHRLVMARTGPGDWAKLDDMLWREKVARRLIEVETYRKLDELRHERSASNHSG